MSRSGVSIVDADLKHRKATFQFERTLLGTFPGAELGLQATIDFKGETVLGQFNRSDGHSENRVAGNVPHLVKVSLAVPTSLLW